MQAETRTLTHLFQPDVRYLIPLYQRPYVWTEDKQWAPLWDDISTIAEHVIAEGATARSPSHFLGAIVVHQQENPPGSPQRFMVIDGQQRLTTLQLLLNAAARTADELGYGNESELIRRLIYNNALLAKGDELFKVWPTNANRLAFETVMARDGDPDTDSHDDPSNEIQEAYHYFQREIRDWASEGDANPSEIADHFSALRITLSDLIKLVTIRLEDGDNPQVIFETLNARGTPLIALDLLKNAVFLTAAREEAGTDQLYSQRWAPELDQDYWREERRAGRLFTKNGDLFLQYWLVTELAEPVPATELFETFRDQVLQRATCPPMQELIPALCKDAALVRGFDNAPTGTHERRFFDLLELLETRTFMPLALLLERSPEVSEVRCHRAMTILEDFLVRRMICGWTTKNYNRLAASLVGAMKKDLGHSDDVVFSRLAAEAAPANRWPGDEDVRSAIEHKDMYGQRRQDRLVILLWRVEEQLRAQDNKVEQGMAAPENLTLEHLIPRSWEEQWPLDDNQDDPLGWRNTHVHRLGNLTLTSGPLNASLSNGPWHAPSKPNDKRRGLVGHSLLKLNTTVAAQHPERFTEYDVDARSDQLADVILRVWPGPTVPASARQA